jgi:hypothetical protein
VTKYKFTTTEATTQLCGTVTTQHKKLFTMEIEVQNKTNGFITTAVAVNTDEKSRTAVWCTSEPMPLDIGKNGIAAHFKGRSRAYNPGDGIVIVREGRDPSSDWVTGCAGGGMAGCLVEGTLL